MMKRIPIMLFAGAILLSACAVNRWVSTPVLNQNNARVSLEYLQESGKPVAQGYNHPYQVDPADLERLLLSLKFIEKIGIVEKAIKGQKPQPVFQADEAALLAPAISEALAKATPDQRVHLVSFNRGGGLIFASRRVTEGIVFAQSPERLNIAFNVINYELLPDEPDEVPDEYKFRDPTSVNDSWVVLIPESSYVQLQPMENGKNSPVWIVVDMNEFKKAPKGQPAQVVLPKTTTSQPLPAEKIEKPAAIAPAETKPVEQQPSAVQASEQPVTPQTNTNEDVKNKLRLLKELYDDGLITQSDYEAEKKKILNNIK
jgi:hypothetical protein